MNNMIGVVGGMALAQPAQEPSETRSCRSCNGTGQQYTGIDEAPTSICKPCDGTGQIALAQPPQREWVGLTAEDFSSIKFPTEMRFPAEFRAGARWAEVKLKDKNI